MEIVSSLIVIAVGGLISGFVIWVVSKLNFGLEVNGFVSAFIAAIIIAMVGGLVNWLLSVLGLSIDGSWLDGIVHFVIGAIILVISDRLYQGIRVAGFVGALIDAIAIGVVHFILGWSIIVLLG